MLMLAAVTMATNDLKCICCRGNVESCQKQINITKQGRESFRYCSLRIERPCDGSVDHVTLIHCIPGGRKWISQRWKQVSSTRRLTRLLVTVSADMILHFSFWYLLLFYFFFFVLFGGTLMSDKLINGLPLPNLSLVINSNVLFRRVKSISLPYMVTASLQWQAVG